MRVTKRNGYEEEFNIEKVRVAVSKALSRTKYAKANSVAIDAIIVSVCAYVKAEVAGKDAVSVDFVHSLVENALMHFDYYDIAREYISYRARNKPDIFKKRVAYKPYVYADLAEYVDAIRHSYWLHTEFNYSSDIQDFKVNLNEHEREVVSRCMLAISQVEVAVKNFWGGIYNYFPVPEVGAVGATFAESEVRHADAYSNLLDILGLSSRFEDILSEPVFSKRFLSLTNNIVNNEDKGSIVKNILLFSVIIENVSLISQFLIMMSFNKERSQLKGISNAIEATSKEEVIHANFGFELVNIVKKENPNLWTKCLIEEIKEVAYNFLKSEHMLVDYLFVNKDMRHLTREQVLSAINKRVHDSLEKVGIDGSDFKYDKEVYNTVKWFDEELTANKNIDFFAKKSTAYFKNSKAFDADKLF